MNMNIEPMKGLLAVDFGFGMPAALAAKFLVENGARVVRGIPEGGDPFARLYPADAAWRSGEEYVDTDLETLLASADICILGGEDFPSLKRRFAATDLINKNPRLIVLDITGYPEGGADAGRPAVDVLVQARSGLVFEHFADRPVMIGFKPALYGAALNGIAGLLAALIEREASGKGQIVSTSLFEGTLLWTASLWNQVENPTPATKFNVPKGVIPLLFLCADDQYIQIMLGTAGGKKILLEVLGLEEAPQEKSGVAQLTSGMLSGSTDPSKFFGDRSELEPAIRAWLRDDLVAALKAKGLAVEPVLTPGACWDDPQVRHNLLIKTLEDGARCVGNPIQTVSVVDAEHRKSPASETPLGGVRVVDFGAFIAGPYASVLLSDLGADVVKVEPRTGDAARSIFTHYSAANRGKRAITVDLKHDEGRNVAAALSAAADVVISNFRTGVSARLGLDIKSLQERRGAQVILELPGFGVSGPKATDAGFDMIMQAFCGHQHRAGGEGNLPAWSRTSMVDFAAGMVGTIAVLLGLLHRRRTGQGVALTAPLLNTGVFLLSELVQAADGVFIGAPQLNSAMTGVHPAEALYQVKNGWIAVAARGAEAGRALVETLGLASQIKAGMPSWGEDETAAIAGVLRNMPQSQALETLHGAGVWAEPCLHACEEGLFDDPFLLAKGIVQENVQGTLGRVAQFGPFVHFSRSRCCGRGPAPTEGQHTRAILGDLGYNEALIEQLYQSGAVA